MRKTKDVYVTAEGRDKGKLFRLTEMPALRSEKWGMRALLALARSGVDLPEDFASSGLAGMAVVGVQALAGLSFADAEPLLDEMLLQVRIVPDTTGNRGIVDRPLMEDDIEEIATLLMLRKEIMQLHVDFFTNAGLLAKVRADLPATEG